MSAILKENIDTLISQYQDGYSLEQAFYCSDEVYQRDMNRLISQRWLLVDHVSRIPNKGDYFLFDIGEESIIIIRQSDEKINAFFNVCRHRGSRICLEHEGNKGLLSCPYHAWTYELDGQLRPPRLMPDGFDKTQFGLHACHIKVTHGLIFVCLSKDTPPDFDAEFSEFNEMFDFHGFADAKIAVKRDYPNQCNWKLVVENFIECYHCAPAHAEYCVVHPEDQLLALGAGPGSGPKEAMEKYQPILDEWEEKSRAMGHPVYEIDHDEHSLHLAQLARLPINDRNFAAETRDGKPASNKLMGKFKQCDHGETAMVFNPISYILASNDVAMMVRFTPRDAVNTDVQLTWLVHKDAEEGVDYDADNVAWVWDVTIKQDKKITEDNNAGILSSRYQPGPYSTQEARVATFVRWYLNGIR
ncbi:MAG: Rieske 2Fe-2S domain-containing protein [Gammaproteobacteria bacterium]|nr:Rieske 2Fe-2S domain-containing protein [Gammaproteobacteria bacterium]